MTHDELLAICDNYSFKDSAEPVKALRAVVELHKPVEYVKQFSDGEILEGEFICNHCNYNYPCPSIQAIEKELK